MTDESQLSNDFTHAQSIDSALSEIEQAMMRFEKIITRHRPGNGREKANTIINSTLSRIFTLLSQAHSQKRTESTANIQINNRFPSSSGQLLAELASSLQKMGGRNL